MSIPMLAAPERLHAAGIADMTELARAGAIWLPNDAKANPTNLTQALARGARNRGVRILERTKVTGWRVDRGRVAGPSTLPCSTTAAATRPT